jgi:hypothetical protein
MSWIVGSSSKELRHVDEVRPALVAGTICGYVMVIPNGLIMNE